MVQLQIASSRYKKTQSGSSYPNILQKIKIKKEKEERCNLPRKNVEGDLERLLTHKQP